MYSMTGYGRFSKTIDGKEMTIELKSVNHRYLDVSLKLPHNLLFLENTIRNNISNKINRGHIDVYVNYTNTILGTKTVVSDKALFESYLSAYKILNPNFCDNVPLATILNMPNVLTVTEIKEDANSITNLCELCLDDALDELIALRKTEYSKLFIDINQRILTIKENFAIIENIAPCVPIEYGEKLKLRIDQMIGDMAIVDQNRLATEVAIFSDKCNIDEEIVRFNSHICVFENLLTSNESIGRKMDFTLQELNREINTIGSKANNISITNQVTNIKAELEKIREQAQNIE